MLCNSSTAILQYTPFLLNSLNPMKLKQKWKWSCSFKQVWPYVKKENIFYSNIVHPNMASFALKYKSEAVQWVLHNCIVKSEGKREEVLQLNSKVSLKAMRRHRQIEFVMHHLLHALPLVVEIKTANEAIRKHECIWNLNITTETLIFKKLLGCIFVVPRTYKFADQICELGLGLFNWHWDGLYRPRLGKILKYKATNCETSWEQTRDARLLKEINIPQFGFIVQWIHMKIEARSTLSSAPLYCFTDTVPNGYLTSLNWDVIHVTVDIIKCF